MDTVIKVKLTFRHVTQKRRSYEQLLPSTLNCEFNPELKEHRTNTWKTYINLHDICMKPSAKMMLINECLNAIKISINNGR